jgi:hypothetical protein
MEPCLLRQCGEGTQCGFLFHNSKTI